jgi:hypothetical protein
MSTKTIKMTIQAAPVRNPIAVAMQVRHGGGCKIMKHRTTPRGGSKNRQAAYRNGDY